MNNITTSVFDNSANLNEVKKVAMLILLCANINQAKLISLNNKEIDIMLEDYELSLCDSVTKIIVTDNVVKIFVDYNF